MLRWVFVLYLGMAASWSMAEVSTHRKGEDRSQGLHIQGSSSSVTSTSLPVTTSSQSQPGSSPSQRTSQLSKSRSQSQPSPSKRSGKLKTPQSSSNVVVPRGRASTPLKTKSSKMSPGVPVDAKEKVPQVSEETLPEKVKAPETSHEQGEGPALEKSSPALEGLQDLSENPLLRNWDQGVRPVAPQKYDGQQGVLQKPFSNEEGTHYEPLMWEPQKLRSQKRKTRLKRKMDPKSLKKSREKHHAKKMKKKSSQRQSAQGKSGKDSRRVVKGQKSSKAKSSDRQRTRRKPASSSKKKN